MPICVFDIHSDGKAQLTDDINTPGSGAYRWLHFDLSDPVLAHWCHANLPELATRSLLQSETRPRCDTYLDGIILNLRAVNLNVGSAVDEMVSLRLWVTTDTIVTVRLQKVFAVDDIRVACTQDNAPKSVPMFLTRLVEGLTLRTRDVALDIDEQTEVLEERYEETFHPDMSDLKAVRRKVIRLRRYLAPQHDALKRLLTLESPVFSGASDRLQLREATNLMTLSTESLEALAARLVALQDHTDGQAARSMNRNSYALSVIAAVFLPLGFFTGLFGVNIAGMPGMNWPGAFAVLTISMVGVGIFCLLLLKWLRLL